MEKELRILIIEDVPHDAELEVRELKRAGMRVTHQLVETEQAFRVALRDFQPELIISDFSMPHFDGMWALALSRELAPDVPFLFVSGTIGEEYAIRALKNGATDYVLKNNLVRLPAAVERSIEDAKARALRVQMERELRESHERFQALLETAPDAIVLADSGGTMVLANAEMERVFGYKREELLGKPVDMLVPDILRPAHTGHRAGYLANPQRRRMAATAELQGRRKDGTLIPVEISLSPVVFNSETHVIGIVRDVTERREQELKIARLSRIHAVLSGINSAIVRIRGRQQLFEEACRIAVEHGNFGIAWIGMLDQKTLEIVPVACAGVEADSFIATSSNTASPTTPLGRGIVGRAVREKRAVYSNDITAEPSQGGARRQEAIRRGYRSGISFPLLVEDEVMGSLSLFAKEINFFDDEEIKLLTELAGDISFALEHIGKEEKLAKMLRIRMISSEINAAIVRIHAGEALLRETCRIASEHGKFEMVWIGTLDHEKREVRPVAWTGFSPETAHAVSWASISAARGTLGEAIQTRKAAVRNDLGAELTSGKLREEALSKGCFSTVCLPLVVDDIVVALIVLFATGREFFDEDELALLNELAADISFALQSISRQEKLEYLSYYDSLTGLPNRQLFIDRVNQQMHALSGEQRMVAIILIDLERFRNLNDTLGRHGGDELLKLIARRLEHAFNGKDFLAHIGADTFGAMIRGVRDAGEIAHAVESQILACFREPFRVDGTELRAAPRAGVALFPADGNDADTLYKNAEAALKNAKVSGERYLFYAPQMNARVAEQLKLENELRRALLEEQFVLYYQPRIDFATGRISGLEALIRWMHPERGLVPPGEFIPTLENTGMIFEAGRWALKRAALDHAAWRAQGLKPPRIAVNISVIHLRRKDFVEDVRTAVAAVDGFEHIDIEITESMMMEDIESNIGKLREIQATGMQVAMDDFGTGYSSLSYLARLPINSLKVDRSFISQMAKGPEQMAIVSTVISLGRALNFKVVAEGVETEEQANLLRLLKCDEAQGYLFGRPVPSGKIVELLRQEGAAAKPAK